MTGQPSDVSPHAFDGGWLDGSFVGGIDPRDFAGAWIDATIPPVS